MNTLIKWIFGFMAFAVVLLLGAAAALVIVVDPNEYKDEIVSQVAETTGRTLHIPGKIAFSFFPWLGLDLGEIVLGNAKGFGDNPFAKITSARVRIRIQPLLNREIQVDTIRVDGLQLNLTQNAKGGNNWQDLSSPSAPTQNEKSAHLKTDEITIPQGQDPPLALAAISIGGLDIRHATIFWQDKKSGLEATIRDFSLESGPIAAHQPLDIQSAFQYRVAPNGLEGNLTLKTQIRGDKAWRIIRVGDFNLEGEVRGPPIPTGRSPIHISLSMELDLDAGTLHITPITLRAMGLSANGSALAQGLKTTPSFQGTLALAGINPKEWITALGLAKPATQDPNALQNASLNLEFNASSTLVETKKLEVKLDESTLSGKASMTDFSNPVYGFDLLLDTINLDRYLPPPEVSRAQTPAQPASPSLTKRATEKKTDLSALKKLQLNGKIHVDKLVVSKVDIHNMDAILAAKQGELALNPLSFNVADGSFSSHVHMNVQTATPTTRVVYLLKNVNAGPLLKTLSGEDRFHGTAHSTAELTMSGLEGEGIKRSLSGKADFEFLNGAIKGVNVAKMIRNAWLIFNGKPPEPEDAEEKTDFSSLTGSVTIQNGLLDNQDLSMLSPLLRISGSGKANLPGETVDYLTNVSLVSSLKGQGGEEIDELKNINIPLTIKGNLLKPSIGIDMQSLLTDRVKKQAEDKIRATIEKKLVGKGFDKTLEKVVPGGIKGLLENLPF